MLGTAEGVALEVRRDIRSRKEVHNSSMKHSSGNSPRHSKARVVIVCTLVRAGFILSGREGVKGKQRYKPSKVGRDKIYRGEDE